MIKFPAKIHAISLRHLTVALALLTLGSCSGLRPVSKDTPILVENDIRINGKPTQSDEDYDIMRQRPNKGIGNIRLFLSMYQ